MNYYRCNVLDSSLLNLPTWKTMSGNLISFDTSYTNNLRSCNVDISAQQAGSGTPSPSNPRTIVGIDEVNVVAMGINLWDEQWELGVFDTTTGADTEASNRIRAKNKIRVKSGTYVSFHSPLSGSNEGLWVIFFDANEGVVSGLSFPNSIDHYGNSFMFHSTTISIPQNVAYLRFYVTYQYGTTYQDDISINASDSDTTYHAYTDTVTTVTLPETIYGGSLEATSGNGKKQVGYIVFDGSEDEDWSYASGNKWATITISDMKSGANQDGITNWLPKSTSYGTFGFALGRNNNNFYAYQIPDISGVTDLASWKTYLSNNPLQVVYPLATPTAFTFTGATIPTLSGMNNIYADTGDISVTAEMTLQEYINQL